jgi:hypothetical protein
LRLRLSQPPAAFTAGPTSDLDLQVQSVTLAADVAEKIGSFTVANNGPAAAVDVGFVVDAGGRDPAKVTFEFDGGGCTPVAMVWDCEYTGTIDTSETWDERFTIKRLVKTAGPVGSIKVTISHEQDENTTNSSQTAEVVLSAEGGVDLFADAQDIWVAGAGHEPLYGEARSASSPVWARRLSRVVVSCFCSRAVAVSPPDRG